jgi:hypothetical protein
MAELTYDDYKERISMQEILQDAGYHFNRRDGLRYPAYVRFDSDGRRIHGDKFIVTANGKCCFQPPERKNYNVISFIKEHPTLFAEYTPGISLDRLVNLVCHRIMNQPIEVRSSNMRSPMDGAKSFKISDYDTVRMDYDNWETQKKFYPYFKSRGITLDTQKAFCGHYFLTTRHRDDGKSFTNLSFPLSSPKSPGKEIKGLEERSRPNAEGKTIYKGLAAGSDASNCMWIAQLNSHRSDKESNTTVAQAKYMYWFESAFDALAYYQIMKKEHPEMKNDLGNSVFISTAGNPSLNQFFGMLRETKDSRHHLCFDNDSAGHKYSELFMGVYKQLGRDESKVCIEYPQDGYKDWNDQVMGKKMVAEHEQAPDEQESERPHFKR